VIDLSTVLGALVVSPREWQPGLFHNIRLANGDLYQAGFCDGNVTRLPGARGKNFLLERLF
jgi:hypothetical protein